jgi:tRNA A37 methylthiotransferase MiaB
MAKKKVSFVSVNFQQGPTELNAYYLPYSVGVLWSYASQFPEITEQWELGEFIWRRDNIDDTAAKLSYHDIIGFSTYVWNKNYNYALAKSIKKLNPHAIIVFGGPEPSVSKNNIFEMHPYIDIVVLQEGEIAFKELLTTNNFKLVSGLLINDSGTVYTTQSRTRTEHLDIIPSPYLNGIFDHLIANNPTVQWNAVIESNRGCPYGCTFCDWGSLTYSKIKKFNLERVCNELEWVGKNSVGFISIADANFGIFPERDNIIADKLIDIQSRYGYPKSYTISWAKNQRAEVLSIVKRLVQNGARQGLTVSVQSLNDSVLEIIKRKNMAINQIDDIFSICDRDNIPVITELILGLPGETLSSWKENYYKLFRANNHNGITVYNAQLIENAEMNLKQRSQYEIKTSLVRDYICGAKDEGELNENVEIINSTNTMPHEDLIQAQLFSWFMNTFHINGITNWLSRFAYARGIDYSVFYNNLHCWLRKNDWYINEENDLENHYRIWFKYGRVNHPPLGNIDIYGINLMQKTSISIHTQQIYSQLFDLLESWYVQKFPEDEQYFDSLFAIQRNYFVRYDLLNYYPLSIDLPYNIIGYIQDGSKLDKPTSYKFKFTDEPNISLVHFCENLWFGRRRNFGKALIEYKFLE